MKFAIAPLVVAYGSSVGFGWSAFTDAVLMIDAPASMCGSAALQRRNIAAMFVSKCRSHSSSGMSSSVVVGASGTRRC